MDIELQRQLFERYPRFFRKPGQRHYKDHDGDEYSEDDAGPLDYWGIECGNGWYEIIDQLAAACESEIEKMADAGIESHTWPRAAQIKEKFGGLRFYLHGPLDEAVRALIRDAADEKSFQVCESCGEPGELRGKGWMHTSCDACEAKIKANRDNQEWDEGAYEVRKAQLQALLDSRLKK